MPARRRRSTTCASSSSAPASKANAGRPSMSLMSPPALKARPAPVSTAALTPWAGSSRGSSSASRSKNSVLSALRRPGRLSVSQATPSRTSHSTESLPTLASARCSAPVIKPELHGNIIATITLGSGPKVSMRCKARTADKSSDGIPDDCSIRTFDGVPERDISKLYKPAWPNQHLGSPRFAMPGEPFSPLHRCTSRSGCQRCPIRPRRTSVLQRYCRSEKLCMGRRRGPPHRRESCCFRPSPSRGVAHEWWLRPFAWPVSPCCSCQEWRWRARLPSP